jgi:metal-responsive CopG/Arc/MetJ family transcriptional regulator
MSNNENMVHVGIYFPKETLKKVDERKGKYYSRNKYFLKIVEKHLNDENTTADDDQKGVRGSQVSSQKSHPEGTTPQSPGAQKTNNFFNKWRSCAW